MKYKKWLLDAGFTNEQQACFVPYENGDIIIGLSIITDHCPGKFIGVIHPDGQEAVDRWCEEHIDLIKKYGGEKFCEDEI